MTNDANDLVRVNAAIARVGCPARVLPRRFAHSHAHEVTWSTPGERGLARIVCTRDLLRAVVELAALPGDH